MSASSTRRRFSVLEVLMAIVAVVGVVVVLSVINHMRKGGQPSIASDIVGVRLGITTFATDVRHFPSTFAEMDSGVALHGGGVDIAGATFGADSANYHGPYLSPAMNGHVIPNGGIFRDALGTRGNQLCMRDSVPAAGPSLVSSSQARRIDSAFDNANGAAGGNVVWIDSTAADQIQKGSLFVCLITYQ